MENQQYQAYYQELLKNFKAYLKLNSQEEEEVLRLFKPRLFKKKSMVLQAGETCNYCNFVVSGCVKMYAIDPDFKAYNLEFASEQSWIMDFKSFYNQQPGKLFIEALEPTVLMQIEHKDLLYLYSTYHKFDHNFRVIFERKLISYQDRMLDNISYTADERYSNFKQQYPELINRLPGTEIASYLGITPEFLSKIKKKALYL